LAHLARGKGECCSGKGTCGGFEGRYDDETAPYGCNVYPLPPQERREEISRQAGRQASRQTGKIVACLGAKDMTLHVSITTFVTVPVYSHT
jgi:hypothetical protein